MTLGQVFLIIAAVLFFFAGVGVGIIPTPVTWGLFFVALGLLTNGVSLRRG